MARNDTMNETTHHIEIDDLPEDLRQIAEISGIWVSGTRKYDLLDKNHPIGPYWGRQNLEVPPTFDAIRR
jgi:hypothetical protein